MKYEKATLLNKSSCVVCGVLLVPADNGKLYNYTTATVPILRSTEDGYKYTVGMRPGVHYCDKEDKEAAYKLKYGKLLDSKTVIQLGPKESGEKYIHAVSISCPKCFAPRYAGCSSASTINPCALMKGYHTERNAKAAEKLGYEYSWHRELGRILIKKGTYLP